MGIKLEEAKDLINQTRNVEFEGMQLGHYGMEGPWIGEVLQEGAVVAEEPTGFSCRVAHPEHVVVHTSAAGKGDIGPIRRWKKGAGQGKDWRDCKDDITTVEDIEQAAEQFGGSFCSECEPLMRASLRHQVRQLWRG